MLMIAIIGVPLVLVLVLVLAYAAVIHWVFRGKVKLAKTSY